MDNVLHIYAANLWHGDAYIVGTKDALENLQTVIKAALKGKVGECQAFVNDGEGFDAIVMMVDEKTADTLACPYTDETARDESGIQPWRLMMKKNRKQIGSASSRRKRNKG